MLRYATLACLCLLASAYDPLYGYRTFNHKLPGERLDHARFIISPDVFEYGESYVVAEYAQNKERLRVNLFLLNDRPNRPTKACFGVELKGAAGTHFMEVRSVRRVSESKVVLTWLCIQNNEVHVKYEVTGYDIGRCERKDLKLDIMTEEPVVVPTANDMFLLFVNNPSICEKTDHPTCWLLYELRSKSRTEPRPFEVQVHWPLTRIEPLGNDTLQIQTSKTLHLMNRTSHKRVKNLPNYEIFGTHMSFCWHVTLQNPLIIHCRQMDDDGRTVFEETIDFDSARSIVDVRRVRDGEILLLTADKNCRETGDDCWNLKATRVIRNHGNVDDIFSLWCTGSAERLVVFGVESKENEIQMHYGCPNGEQFYFGFVSAHRYDF